MPQLQGHCKGFVVVAPKHAFVEFNIIFHVCAWNRLTFDIMWADALGWQVFFGISTEVTASIKTLAFIIQIVYTKQTEIKQPNA